MALKSRRIFRVTEITESVTFRSAASVPEKGPVCPLCGSGSAYDSNSTGGSGESAKRAEADAKDAASPEVQEEVDDRFDSRVRQAIAQEKGVLK